VQQSTNNSFSSNLLDVCNTVNPTCSINGRIAGTYYYRVRGGNGSLFGEWSNTQSVTVLLPTTPLLQPIPNVDNDGEYTITWGVSPLATSYTLQEDTDNSFSTPANVYSGTNLSKVLTGQLAGSYYYRVKAVGPTGESTWSVTQPVSVLPPGIPTIHAVDNPDYDGNYSLNWSTSVRTTSYVLQEDSSNAFQNPLTIYSGSGYSYGITNHTIGTYYYRVRSDGPTGTSGWSNTVSTTVYPSGVHILGNHTTFTSYGTRYVVGEVLNNTPNYLEFVKISVNFYNGGQLVETDYTYTDLWDLHPNEKTCFKIYLNNPPIWDQYTFEPVAYWIEPTTTRPSISVVSHSGSVYQGSYYRILGQIKNDEAVNIDYPMIVASLYDAQGKVVDCEITFGNIYPLAPAQITSFSLVADPQSPNLVTSYALQTDGLFVNAVSGRNEISLRERLAKKRDK
jgi:hypothetical protein